jgi:molybdopterin converting factor small subunit
MSPTVVTVLVPTQLRDCCAGAAKLAVSAADLRGALEQLEALYPRLHGSICDETGAVRKHIGLFVNTAHIGDRRGLDTQLQAGDILSIFPAVSGG